MKDKIGIVYLFTNDYLEKENTYKFGITDNPFERKRIQSNSTPPTHPFYYKLIVFSTYYKTIEKWLEKQFKSENLLLKGEEGGGKEWVRAAFSKLLSIYMKALESFSDAQLCYDGKRYQYVNNTIEIFKLPNCCMDLLGITDGEKIKCIEKIEGFTTQEFVVKDNKIIVDNEPEPITLSNFINKYYQKRNGKTNEHNGYEYFKYKDTRIDKMWRLLVKPDSTKK